MKVVAMFVHMASFVLDNLTMLDIPGLKLKFDRHVAVNSRSTHSASLVPKISIQVQ